VLSTAAHDDEARHRAMARLQTMLTEFGSPPADAMLTGDEEQLVDLDDRLETAELADRLESVDDDELFELIDSELDER